MKGQRLKIKDQRLKNEYQRPISKINIKMKINNKKYIINIEPCPIGLKFSSKGFAGDSRFKVFSGCKLALKIN
jgi:hypothetical protein